jgi:hypothetical protein
MAISDLFSTSFLFSIAIIIILIGGIFAYVSYRMAEQDHKLTTMVNLVSILAQDLQVVRSKVVSMQQQDNPNVEYPSQMMGGQSTSDLISVSDDGDEEEEEEDIDDNTTDEEESYSSEDDNNDDEEELEDSQEQIKLLINNIRNVCKTNGLGGDANEYRIVTQSFLYKYINDKFMYEVEKIDSNINSFENLKKLNENQYQKLLIKIGN